MFHFPTFPPHALCVQARVTPHDWCGVPPFGNPRINARLTAPRGLSQPPTSFIGSWCPGIHRVPLTTWPHTKTPHNRARKDTRRAGLQELFIDQESKRCSRPLCSSQRTTRHRSTDPTRPAHPLGEHSGMRCRPALTRDNSPSPAGDGPLSQDPTACLRTSHPHPPRSTRPHPEGHARRTGGSRSCRPNWSAFHPRAPPRQPAHPPELGGASTSWRGSGPAAARLTGLVLLRKEVIQPHLPVRLPCYDFVPIADPTFDSSHNRPLASGVTNFHDVTGGVYKARERIHRSVADLRLLATPTSWGRVADPNPN